MNRRKFIAGLSLSTAYAYYSLAANTRSLSLKTAAASRGLLFGTECTRKELEHDPAYAELVKREAAIITPGLEFKWDALRPSVDEFNFTNSDWMVKFARANGLQVRGHNFCWHQAVPDWLARTMRPSNARDLLSKHINTVVTRYRGSVQVWDVANEIVEPAERRSDDLKSNLFLNHLGPDYVPLAFHLAREADPKATLTWNENWLESESEYCRTKRNAVLKLLSQWKRDGVPIDCLGLQAHLFAETKVAAGFPRFLEEVAQLGVKIAITELDVRDRNLDASTGNRDQRVADRYRDLLEACLHNVAVTCVQTWGLSDRYTWINNDARSRRVDGLPSRPLPFDANLDPKPAYRSMLSVLS